MSDDLEIQQEEDDFQSKVSVGTFGRVVAQTRPYWYYFVGFLISISVVSVIDAAITFVSKRVVDEVIVAKNIDALPNLVGLYIAGYVGMAIFVFAFIVLAGILGERVQHDLRAKVFAHLQHLSLSYFDRTPLGWLLARNTSDIQRVGDLASWGILDVTWSVVNLSAVIGFMLYMQWQLALLVMMVLPILVIVAMQFQKKILKEQRKVRKVNSKITAAFNESITGVRVVKALGREAANLREFQVLTGEMYQAGFRAAWLSALFLPLVQVMSALAAGSVLWYTGQTFSQQVGGMTVGGMQAFITYAIFMMWPIQQMARVFAEMQRALASAERVFTLLDTPSEIVDRPNAQPADSLRGEIVFDSVSFGYQGGQHVLQDFNLRVQPGEMIALVGATGAGKSTVVNLLCRFYEPTAGRILIAGKDYTTLTLHSIHSRLGIVLQTPHLFAGTIRENLRYGNLTATDEEIETASRLTGAAEFIQSLSATYDTQVGEGGSLLSAGQKQLVSITRAILANPDIFIMDEATSSVDTLTEALIQKGMATVLAGRTSFVVAHRLSTIKRANRILVLEKGNIKEMGTHAELMRARGDYYHLYTHQFRTEREQAYEKEFATGLEILAPS